MKNIILLIIVVAIFIIGFFLWKGSPQGIKLSQQRDNTTISQSGIIVQDNSTGAVAPISKEKFTQLCSDYIISWNSWELLRSHWDDTIRIIDNAKKIYPFSWDILKLIQIPAEERINALKSNFINMKPGSMWYATVSDLINGTNLCESFPKQEECKEQLEFLEFVVKNWQVPRSTLILTKPKLIWLYAEQNHFDKSQYQSLLNELAIKYCKSI